MGDFDKILKENIEAVFLPTAEKILGISINATGILQRSPVDLWEETYELKDKIQITISHGILWMNESLIF